MSDDSVQLTPVGDVLRRLIEAVSVATRLDDIASALHAAAATILPVDRMQLQMAGGPAFDFSRSVSPQSLTSPPREPTPDRLSYVHRSDAVRPVRTGELIADLSQHDEPRSLGPAEMKATLAGNSGQLGSVTVQSFRVPSFSPADANLLSLLVDGTAPALERVAQKSASANSEAHARLFDSIQQIVAESSSISGLFEAVTRVISDTFDVGCGLAMDEPSRTPVVTAFHPVEDFASAATSWLADLLKDHDVKHLLRTEVNPLSFDQVRRARVSSTGSLLMSAPVRSVHLFPLATTGRWCGGLLLFDDTMLSLNVESRDTLKRVAHVLGLAIGNFLNPTGTDNWQGWARVITGLSSGEPITTVLRDILTIGLRIIPADGAMIRLQTEDVPLDDRNVVVGDTGFTQLLDVLANHGSLDALLDGDVLGSVRPLSPRQRESHLELLRRLRAPLVLPIQSGDVRFGCLAIFRSGGGELDAAEMADARQFVSVIAATLHQHRTIDRQLRQDRTLTTVRTLAQRLNHASTQHAMAEIAVEIAADAFDSGKATVHVYQEQSDRLVMAAAYGMPLPFVTANAHPAVGAGPCGTAAQRRSIVVIEDVTADSDWMSVWHVDEANLNFRSVWSVPLLAGEGHLLGTLTVFHTNPGAPSEDDASFLQVLGHQIGGALDRARLADRSQSLYRASVESLAAAVDAKDPFTHNHSWQVATYSRKIAEALRLPASETEVIELAGLLHDVGKIGIPDRVLQKPDALAPDEWAMMQRHPDLGARILGDNAALAPVVPLVRHHHERYDGRGYPDQLAGNDIPLGAAIVGLADAFDTMTSDRPYRKGRTLEQAIQEVKRSRGSHFNPRVVDAFLELVSSGGISRLTSAAPRSTTRELRLSRVVGAEARGFGLLQRITTEIGALVDLDRFLHRLNELMTTEFPDSVCEIYGQDSNSGNLVAIANRRRQKALIIPRGQGIAGWVAANGMSQNVSDVLEDPRYLTTKYRLMRSVLAVPLVVDGHCAGVLSLEHPEPGAYTQSDQHVLEIVATYVAQAIQVANLHDRLKHNTNCDPLTGLPNHHEFCRRLEEEIGRARLTAGKLAIAILDVQDLRSINQRHGHAAGDTVLKGIAEALKSKVRGGDTVARYGGDEFALLVPRVSGPSIRSRVNSIPDLLAGQSFPHALPGISYGIGSFPSDGTRAEEIIAAAESALRDSGHQQTSTHPHS